MKNLRTTKVRIVSGQAQLEYDAQITVYTSADALKRAVLAYVASLLLCVFCVFIPGVHFIAVPGLLLLGPVIAFLIWKAFAGQEDVRVENPRCPACQGPIELASTLALWPLRDRCAQCGVSYVAELAVSNSK